MSNLNLSNGYAVRVVDTPKAKHARQAAAIAGGDSSLYQSALISVLCQFKVDEKSDFIHLDVNDIDELPLKAYTEVLAFLDPVLS